MVKTTPTEKAASSEQTGKLLTLPLENIEVGPRARLYHPEQVQELKINIEDIGLINPITVSVSEDGIYTLIAGRHRLEAFRELLNDGKQGYAEIPALVAKAEDAKRIELCENLYRNDLSILEKAEHLHTYLRSSSDTVSETLDNLAQQAKQSKRTFYRLKAIGSGIQVADEIKKLPAEQAQEIMNSTRQLYFLAKQSKEEQKAILKVLKKEQGLYVQQAAAKLQGKEETPAPEKRISFRLPSSLGQQLAKLSEQRQMKPGDFAEKFMSAALRAYKQGNFNLEE